MSINTNKIVFETHEGFTATPEVLLRFADNARWMPDTDLDSIRGTHLATCRMLERKGFYARMESNDDIVIDLPCGDAVALRYIIRGAEEGYEIVPYSAF
jgi:hypothetical protein